MTDRSDRCKGAALALLPVVPPLSLFALISLRDWSALPSQWRTLLLGFIATQLGAALLAPDPWFALLLASGRALLVVALVLSGFRLERTQVLAWALVGYAVVGVTAFVTSLRLLPATPLAERLVHPYYTSVSLGLAGAIGLLLALTWRGAVWWRVLGGGLCLGMFVWSGSRGPLIALVAGVLAALAVNLRGQWRSLLVALATAGALLLAVQATPGQTVASRFKENTLTGRGTYWADALDTARQHPWGGVGPYQLGPHLSTQYGSDSCRLWLAPTQQGSPVCPAALQEVRGMWLIAHNTAFHLLGETGVIGTTGWLALMAALAGAAWRSRDPLLNALTWATAAMGLVDNPTLLPSLGHAELYWLAGGVALSSLAQNKGQTTFQGKGSTLSLTSPSPLLPVVACLMAGYWATPLWLEHARPRPKPVLPALYALVLPGTIQANQRTLVFLNVVVSETQNYVLSGQLCSVNQPKFDVCRQLFTQPLKATPQGWQSFALEHLNPGTYTLMLSLTDQTPHLQVERPAAQLSRVIHVR